MRTMIRTINPIMMKACGSSNSGLSISDFGKNLLQRDVTQRHINLLT